ncbi:MAG TPA: tetratricopeptide repeat protein [Vicinamibacterales bacterium]|nr:tetratricopeptide repeat protein [Vicinamibacterales bacterium]
MIEPQQPRASEVDRTTSSRGATALVLVAFAIVFAALRVNGYSQKSGTFDEPIHLAAGFAAIVSGDFRFDPTHPPLIRMWAALPLLFMSPSAPDLTAIDRLAPERWLERATGEASRFLYEQNDADRLLYAARFMIVVVGILTGVLLFFWTREWFGTRPAIAALAFFAMLPGTHASWVTTDLAVATFVFAAVYALWRVCQRPTPANLSALGVSIGLAVTTKFSGLMLAPILIALIGVACWRQPSMTWRRATALAGFVVAASILAIWLAYGGRYAPSASPAWLFAMDRVPSVQADLGPLLPIVRWIDAHHLLPNAYTHGFLWSFASARLLPSFLAGEISSHGWWYYFPFAFLIKTPLALLVLGLIGVAVVYRERHALGAMRVAWMLAPIAIAFAVAMTTRINLGLRHVLVVYPFVLLVAAAAVRWLLARPGWIGRTVVILLALQWGVRYASVYPHTLGYFNVFVGGPGNGSRYLTDSNVDWGQDLKLLKAWMDDRRVARINLAYFGSAAPEYYRIDCTRLPGAVVLDGRSFQRPVLPGYVAISSTVQSGVYLPRRWRMFYRAFRDLAPVTTVGSSIRVYWVEQWPEVPLRQKNAAADPADVDGLKALADSTRQLGWDAQAAGYYRRYLRHRPDDAAVHDALGQALFAQNDRAGAVDAFARATTLAPDRAAPRRSLAVALLSLGRAEDAAGHARELVRRSPENVPAHDLLGRAFVALGRIAEAEASFRRALTIDPTFAPAIEALRQIARRPVPEPSPPLLHRIV